MNLIDSSTTENRKIGKLKSSMIRIQILSIIGWLGIKTRFNHLISMMLGFILEKWHIRASTKHLKCGVSQSHSLRCGDNPFSVLYDSEETELV